MYVSGLTKNLFSVGSIAYDGYKLLFDSGQIHILKDFDLADIKCIVASGNRDNHNGLYLLGSPQDECLNLSESSNKSDQLWHCRLGHLNPQNLEFMIRTGKVQGLPNLEISKHTCEACQRGKQCRERKPKGKARRMRKTFKLLHTDLCGSLHVPSALGKNIYLNLYI